MSVLDQQVQPFAIIGLKQVKIELLEARVVELENELENANRTIEQLVAARGSTVEAAAEEAEDVADTAAS